jgi:hypothetical protein
MSTFPGTAHPGHGAWNYWDSRGQQRCSVCHHIVTWNNVAPGQADQEPERFTWVVEITIDKIWVEDGFDLTDDRLKEMVLCDLTYAHDSEVAARVVGRPSPAAIRLVQGYRAEEIDLDHPAVKKEPPKLDAFLNEIRD